MSFNQHLNNITVLFIQLRTNKSQLVIGRDSKMKIVKYTGNIGEITTGLTCRGDCSHHSLRSSLLLVNLVDSGARPGRGGQKAEEEDDLHGV